MKDRPIRFVRVELRKEGEKGGNPFFRPCLLRAIKGFPSSPISFECNVKRRFAESIWQQLREKGKKRFFCAVSRGKILVKMK